MFVIPEHYALITQQQIHDIFFALCRANDAGNRGAVERMQLFSIDGNLFSQL